MSGYYRLGHPGGPPQSSEEDHQQQRVNSPFNDPRYQYSGQSPSPEPYADPRYQEETSHAPMPRSDSRGYHPASPPPMPPVYQHQQYQMEERPPPHLNIPMAPGADHRMGTPSDMLQQQPTYSVENVANSYGHEQAYLAQHRFTPQPDAQQYGGGEYAFNPQDHHDAYYNPSYEPSPQDDDLGQYPVNGQAHHFQDYSDTRPILHTDTSYGPDPHQGEPSPNDHTPPNGAYMDAQRRPAPTPSPAPITRKKTTKRVQLFNGNLVLDCPVPPRLLNQVPHAPPPERDEFTHMRYSAVTCDPKDFYNERFTLRPRLFAKPRHTELFIVITMYNEEDELFARTMMGVIRNIEFMNSRTNSQTWGKDAWKKIVVCVVADGRSKINPRTRAVLAAMGVYQEGIAKQQVNSKDVTAHIYEYTTQMTLDISKGIVNVKKGQTPIQMIFCLKEKNQKKINSHRWFFQAFGSVLDPNICVLIDAGTKPGKDSIYQLWKAFDIEPMCAGACGEIKAMLSHGKNLRNPLVAAQNFEYKMSNILDKPLESAFGFISVLPGAFSAYRYVALQNDKSGQGPLEKYFAGETMHGANAGIFTANMYLAEDRILCFELVAKRNCHWILQYVKSATGETDVPTEVADFILQRRRWLNGSFFAAVYAITHFFQIFRSEHSGIRKLMFGFEFFYQTVSMLFAWFGIGNFFLVFRILTTSLGDPTLLGTAGEVLSVIFEWAYLITLVACFVLALGNRPKGSNRFYVTMVYFWAVLMAYLIFAAIFITVKSVEKQLAEKSFSFGELFTNKIFFTLIVSMLSTYLLYFISSILCLDPWHMFTSFVQYLFLTPSYINILNVYAFCNTHDVTWGTKGDDKPAALPTVKLEPGGGVDVHIPVDDHDLNSQYEAELRVFSRKYEPVKEKPKPENKQEDYYKGFRSAVVLVWMFCNLALAAVVLNTGGFERVQIGGSNEVSANTRATIYMQVVLWAVAFLAAIRFIGCVWFLIVRLIRGV